MLLLESILLSSGITLLLNYCLGKPGNEFSPYEIFSDYTIWLSKRRLREMGLIKTYNRQYNDSLGFTEKHHEVINLKNDFKKMLYNAAEPYFTWERAFGMCVICTGVWISVIVGVFVTKDFSGFIENIVISHILIRLLNKIL